MSSLVQLYGRQFRKHLGYHPVWPPGAAIEPGAIGRLHEGVFAPQGHVRERLPALALSVAENSTGGPMKFSVGVSMRIGAEASAKVQPSARVSGSLRFERGGGVLLHARDLAQRSLKEIHALLGAVPWDDPEWRDTLLVSEVLAAGSVGLMLSETGDTAVEVSGKAGPLQSLELADASVSFGAASSAIYSVRLPAATGPHPTALRLYGSRRTWLGLGKARPQLLEVEESEPDGDEPPFVQLSPHALDR